VVQFIDGVILWKCCAVPYSVAGLCWCDGGTLVVVAVVTAVWWLYGSDGAVVDASARSETKSGTGAENRVEDKSSIP